MAQTTLDRIISQGGTQKTTSYSTLDKYLGSSGLSKVEEMSKYLKEKDASEKARTEEIERKRIQLEQANKSYEEARKQAEDAGSFWGLTKETIKGIPSSSVEGAQKAIGFAGDILKSTARMPVTIPTRTLLTIGSQIGVTPSEYTPQTSLEKFIVGEEPIKSYTKTQEEAQKFGEQIGIPKVPATILGATGAGAEIALDFMFGGKGKTAEQIVKIGTEKEAKDFIAKIGAEESGNIIERIIKTNKKKDAEIIAKELEKSISEKNAIEKAGTIKTEIPSRVSSDISEVSQVEVPKVEVTPGLEKSEITTSNKISHNDIIDAEKYVQELSSLKKDIKDTKEISSIKQKIDEAKTKLVDFTAPIEDLFRNAQKKYGYEVVPEKNISYLIDNSLNSSTIGWRFFKNGGMEDVIKAVPDQNILDQYLIAKQAKMLESRGIVTGRNASKDAKLIEVFKGEYEPFARKVNDYSQKLLDYSAESGLISKSTANELKKIYPDYVPMNRVFSEAENALNEGRKFSTRAVASLGEQTIVKKIKGSMRQIESPIESLLSKTIDAFNQGERNKAARTLYEYKDLPGFEGIFNEVKKGDSVKSTKTFSFIDNGIKKTIETTPEIAAAAKALNVQVLSSWMKAMAIPVRLLKLGTTGINIPFTITNVIKDTMFANTVSKNSIRSFANLPKAIFEALGHGKIYNEMVDAGAINTSFDISRDLVSESVEKIRASRNKASKIIYTAKNPQELLRIVEDIVGRAEEVNRISQYIGAKNTAISMGVDPKRAAILGAMAARENSVNFMRKGEYGSVLNSLFPYLNAGIQGNRRMVRELTSATTPLEKTKFGLKFALMYGAPLTAITLWNLDDKKRREVYNDISEFEKEDNFIFVTDAAEKNTDGKWDGVIKIPLTPGLGDAAQIFRKSIESIKGYDDKVFSDIATSLLRSVSPIPTLKATEEGGVTPDVSGIASTITPQAIKPSIESYVNKNLYTGKDIVPYGIQDLPKELQYKESTSEFAKTLGAAIGLSPLKIDAFIKSTFGSVGSQISGKENIVEGVKRRFYGPTGGEVEAKDIKKILDIQEKRSAEDFQLNKDAEEMHSKLKTMNKNEANRIMSDIKKDNKRLFDKIVDVKQSEDLNLTHSEKMLKQLGVENGDRAAYIHSKAMELGTRDERNSYILELRKKKIVSDSVLKQLKELSALEK